MLRAVSLLLAGSALCAIGLLSAHAQEPKKAARPVIPGGIEGHVKSVNQEKQTLAIVTSKGSERTFTIREDTTVLGPRGMSANARIAGFATMMYAIVTNVVAPPSSSVRTVVPCSDRPKKRSRKRRTPGLSFADAGFLPLSPAPSGSQALTGRP